MEQGVLLEDLKPSMEGRVHQVVRFWVESYSKKKGVPYVWKKTKDAGSVKRCLDYFDKISPSPKEAFEELAQAAQRYLCYDSKFFRERGWLFSDFANNPAPWVLPKKRKEEISVKSEFKKEWDQIFKASKENAPIDLTPKAKRVLDLLGGMKRIQTGVNTDLLGAHYIQMRERETRGL